MRIDACDREKVILEVHAPKIAERERPLQCRNGYGSPQVDYLKTALQERWRFVGGNVTMDDGNSGCRSLVSMSPRERLSIVGVSVRLARSVTANN